MKKKTIIMNLPPVIIDSHCHGRGLAQSYKTTVKKTIFGATRSGIGISVFMPNTSPAIIDIETLDIYIYFMRQARKTLGVRRKQYLYFGLTDHNLSDCEIALKYPEVVGLKDYPMSAHGKTVTTGTIGVSDSAARLEGMKLTKKHNKVYARHCDNPMIVGNHGNIIAAEVADVKDTISLLEKVTGAKVVICHVSCKQSAEMILDAQKAGMQIAIELCPHYLWFDSDGTNWTPKLNPVFYHCFNNLRPKEHREYLVQLLKTDNKLIFIGSDHANHTAEEKLIKNFGGLPGNKEMRATICALAKMHHIPEKRVAELLSWNSGDFLGIEVPKKLVPIELEWRIDDINYNNGEKIVNPWNGSRLLFPVRKEEAM